MKIEFFSGNCSSLCYKLYSFQNLKVCIHDIYNPNIFLVEKKNVYCYLDSTCTQFYQHCLCGTIYTYDQPTHDGVNM